MESLFLFGDNNVSVAVGHALKYMRVKKKVKDLEEKLVNVAAVQSSLEGELAEE